MARMLPGYMAAVAVLLTVVAPAALAFTNIFNRPVPALYQYPGQMVPQQIESASSNVDDDFTCPGAGFFVNPTNCSRFYRCVDFAGDNSVFSKYPFECPANQVFLAKDKNTCVPGTSCSGNDGGSNVAATPGYQPPVQPVQIQPVPVQPVPVQPVPVQPVTPVITYPPLVTEPSTLPPVTYPPNVDVNTPAVPAAGSWVQPAVNQPATGIWGQPGVSQPAVGQPAVGQPAVGQPAVGGGNTGAGAAQPGGVYPQPSGQAASASDDGAAAAGGATVVQEKCPKRYVQDSQYCNVYRPCENDKIRYICADQTVFDEANQLCVFEEGSLCEGKEKRVQASLRSSLVYNGLTPSLLGQDGITFYSAPNQAQLPYAYSFAQPQPFYYIPINYRK